MGRELRRVALDFDWPLREPWKGFLNPHYTATLCPVCSGSDGLSPLAHQLVDAWYGYVPFKPEDRGSKPFTPDHPGIQKNAAWNSRDVPEYRRDGTIRREAWRLCELFNAGWVHHLNQMDVDALVDSGRLYDFTHKFVPGQGWQPRQDATHPTAQEVNDWSIHGFGHDSINQWVVVRQECYRQGIPYVCSHCDGEAAIWPSHEAHDLYEAWTQFDPPEGDGYQLWETVSEGSPVSPVCVTPEELATWLTTPSNLGPHDVTRDTTFAQWLEFIHGPGWAPSLVTTKAGLVSGVQAVLPSQEAAS